MPSLHAVPYLFAIAVIPAGYLFVSWYSRRVARDAIAVEVADMYSEHPAWFAHEDQKRALSLLWRFLTDEQKKTLLETPPYIDVTTRLHEYRLYGGHTYHRRRPKGQWYLICIQETSAAGWIPWPDRLLVKLMAIQADEPSFLATANSLGQLTEETAKKLGL